MPEIIIVAGPNGAGKTSFANKYFAHAREGLEFINADEIARELDSENLPKPIQEMRAGREMLIQIDALVNDGTEFMFETTLATLNYSRKIPIWQKQGYWVSLIYLRLPSVEDSIARVARRVENGGHDIPEKIIRRRFQKSLDYLNNIYKPIVDDWYVYDSLENEFKPAEFWDDQ